MIFLTVVIGKAEELGTEAEVTGTGLGAPKMVEGEAEGAETAAIGAGADRTVLTMAGSVGTGWTALIGARYRVLTNRSF